MGLTLRVRYPAAGRPITLRTDDDWDVEVQPAHTGEDGNRTDFVLPTGRPWLEFKICLRERDGSMHWSQGGNYVASAASPAARDVFPTFHSAETGHISEPREVPGTDDAPAHVVRAYVPPGYEENPLRRYPVVYMHDGTNLFFPDEAFSGRTWNVHGTLDALNQMNSTHPVIVIGVQAVDREREYTAAGWERYGRYLVHALKPRADELARTSPDPASTVVMGSSLGGLVSLYLAWQWPDVFGGAACLSSTFAFDDELFHRVAKEPRRPIRVYLDSGYPRDNYEATLGMRNLLLRKGYRWGEDLLHFAHPGHRHDEAAWARRLHLPFQFFFGRGPTYA